MNANKPSFNFYINGLVFKQRPGFNSITKTAYTKQKTKEWQTAIAWLAKEAMQKAKIVEPLEGAIKVTIKAVCTKPLAKPDCDNIAKIILDSLNKVAYKDDKQVIELHITKAELLDWKQLGNKSEGIYVTVEELI